MLSILLAEHKLSVSLEQTFYKYQHPKMSTPHTDTDMPFPHASVLAYFRQPVTSQQVLDIAAPPPPYSDRPVRQEALPSNDHAEEDEESNCGFFEQASEHKSTSSSPLRKTRGHRRMYDTCCLWFTVLICALVAFGTFFAFDLFGSQYGMSTGMAKWMINSGRPSSQVTYEVSSQSQRS
jgi:hypothetical protein